MMFFSLIFCFSDSTFNQTNLKRVVKENDEWKLLRFLIGDRNSQDNKQELQKGHETCRMLVEWQKMHPYASWTLLYQALIKMNERVMSVHIKRTYLSGSFILVCRFLHIKNWGT